MSSSGWHRLPSPLVSETVFNQDPVLCSPSVKRRGEGAFPRTGKHRYRADGCIAALRAAAFRRAERARGARAVYIGCEFP